MEKYLSIRVQTALYISIFFISLQYVFVYLANSSIMEYTFGLNISQILSIYGIASIFGITVCLFLLKKGLLVDNIKKSIYIATILELLSLFMMYYSSLHLYIYVFIAFFSFTQLLTPFILFRLDTLFEAYTHIEERGKGRGIYLTIWNLPFIIVPVIMSILSMSNLSVVYIVSSLILIPFIYLIFKHIKNPSEIELMKDEGIKKELSSDNPYLILKDFFKDKLNRNSFLTKSTLHLYYGSTTILLPIYLYSVFHYEWNKIGLILAVMSSPCILIQIPFGDMEDRDHNEKKLYKIGIVITIVFTILALKVSPTLDPNLSFILLSIFLFIAYAGCSLIEISIESTFYKHVTERDTTALLMFRIARIFPYVLGILGLAFILI